MIGKKIGIIIKHFFLLQNGSDFTIMKKVYIIILSCIATAIFYLQNLAVPYFTDDLGFMYYNGKRIETFTQYQDAIINSYFHLNARMWCQVWSFGFSSFVSEHVFDIVNTLLFIVTVYLSTRLLNLCSKNILSITVLVLGYFSISDGTNQLFYWACGSGNYLLSICFVILIMLIEKKYRNDSCFMKCTYLCPIVFFLSMINEALLIPLCIAYFICYASKFKKLTNVHVAILLGLLLGTTFVVFCPGTLSRAGRNGVDFNFVELAKRLVSLLISLKMFYVLITSLAVGLIFKREYTLQYFKKQELLIVLAFAGMIPAFLSGGKGRVLISCELFSMFALVVYLKNVVYKRTLVFSTILFSLFCIFEYWITYDSFKIWNEYRVVVEKYMKQKNNVIIWNDSYKPSFAGNLYVIDPIRLFETKGTTERLAKIKSDLQCVDSVEYMTILPYSLKKAIENGGLFKDDNRINSTSNNNFFTTSNIEFYVAEYDSILWQKIEKGCFTKKYYCNLVPSLKLNCNFSKSDINDAVCPATVIKETLPVDVIMINKNYKSYTGFTLEEILIEDAEPHKKFNLYVE